MSHLLSAHQMVIDSSIIKLSCITPQLCICRKKKEIKKIKEKSNLKSHSNSTKLLLVLQINNLVFCIYFMFTTFLHKHTNKTQLVHSEHLNKTKQNNNKHCFVQSWILNHHHHHLPIQNCINNSSGEFWQLWQLGA